MLYAKRFGTSEPNIEVFGKPMPSTFDYARVLLEKRKAAIDGSAKEEGNTMDCIYMVGGEIASYRCLPLACQYC